MNDIQWTNRATQVIYESILSNLPFEEDYDPSVICIVTLSEELEKTVHYYLEVESSGSFNQRFAQEFAKECDYMQVARLVYDNWVRAWEEENPRSYVASQEGDGWLVEFYEGENIVWTEHYQTLEEVKVAFNDNLRIIED